VYTDSARAAPTVAIAGGERAGAWRKALTEGSGQGFLVDPLMLGAEGRGPVV
jgi:hypothetical protein